MQSYLAAGKPIIAALNGEGADIIKVANAGFTCAAGNAVGLAEIVRKISELPSSERLAMGRNGLEFSKREFDRRMVLDMAEKYFSRLFE